MNGPSPPTEGIRRQSACTSLPYEEDVAATSPLRPQPLVRKESQVWLHFSTSHVRGCGGSVIQSKVFPNQLQPQLTQLHD